MTATLRTLLLTALVSLAPAGALWAQQMIQVPPELEAGDSRAPVASGLATPILAGDRAAAEAYLLRHSAAGYDAAQARTDLDAAIQALAGTDYEIEALRQGEAGVVLVPLRRKGESDPAMILVVGMQAAAPHGIQGVRASPVRIVREGGE